MRRFKPVILTALIAILHGASAVAAELAPTPRTVLMEAAGPSKLKVTTPPKGYNAFYTKYVSASGFPVLASERVSNYALLEAAWLINNMLEPRPDVQHALTASGCRFAVMAAEELTTDIPEHSDLTPKQYWNRRARGLGATPQRPAVSCGEENLLCYRGDPYKEENILVHEFAHALHLMGLKRIEPDFDSRLKKIYDRAMAEGLWKGKYAATNKEEYWAEGVQSFFDTNRPPDHDHNHVRTRAALKEYDPRLAELISEIFRESPWRYSRPEDRKQPGHLTGYDPKKGKAFAWPKELIKPIPKS
jgi:hypothetical protein